MYRHVFFFLQIIMGKETTDTIFFFRQKRISTLVSIVILNFAKYAFILYFLSFTLLCLVPLDYHVCARDSLYSCTRSLFLSDSRMYPKDTSYDLVVNYINNYTCILVANFYTRDSSINQTCAKSIMCKTARDTLCIWQNLHVVL